MDGTNKNTAENKPKKFTIERLRRDCLKLFGVTESTFEGATFGKSGELTVDEAKKLIGDWQKTEIKPKGKKEKQEGK